jgi:hypothetical protein
VIVESEKRPLFRRCRPHEPYAESLLLRDMAQTLRVCDVWQVRSRVSYGVATMAARDMFRRRPAPEEKKQGNK